MVAAAAAEAAAAAATTAAAAAVVVMLMVVVVAAVNDACARHAPYVAAALVARRSDGGCTARGLLKSTTSAYVYPYIRTYAYKRRPRECRDLWLRAALHSAPLRSVVPPPRRVDRDEDAGLNAAT